MGFGVVFVCIALISQTSASTASTLASDRCGIESRNPWNFTMDGVQCESCGPGQLVQTHCTLFSRTICAPCPANTFNECFGFAEWCATCRKICPERDQAISSRSGHCPAPGAYRDSLCLCKDPGSYMYEELHACFKQIGCTPGREVTIPGNRERKTKCRRCKKGFFQPSTGLRVKCKPITNCGARGLREKHPGTRKHDALCGSPLRVPQSTMDPILARASIKNTTEIDSRVSGKIATVAYYGTDEKELGGKKSTILRIIPPTDGFQNSSTQFKRKKATAQSIFPVNDEFNISLPSSNCTTGTAESISSSGSEEDDQSDIVIPTVVSAVFIFVIVVICTLCVLWKCFPDKIHTFRQFMIKKCQRLSRSSNANSNSGDDVVLQEVISSTSPANSSNSESSSLMVHSKPVTRSDVKRAREHVRKRMLGQRKVYGEIFLHVAEELGLKEYAKYLRKLGNRNIGNNWLTDNRIDNFRDKYSKEGLHEALYRAQNHWFESNPNADVVQSVMSALEDISRNDMASEVQDIVNQLDARGCRAEGETVE